MSLFSSDTASFDEVLALRPALQKKYASFLEAIELSDDVPERVFTLCRARIQQIHGQATGGVTPEDAVSLASLAWSSFSPGEQAALNVAEKMPFQHHLIEDQDVEAIKQAFGDAGSVSLLTALAFFDVSSRLNATIKGAAN